jgi:hypothetical protein
MAASDITCAALATISDTQGVKLKWTYSDPRSGALPNIALDAVEVWAASTNDRAGAAKVGEGIVDFLHAGLGRGDVRYYWVKARDKIGGYGAWYPSGATSGVSGTEASGDVLLNATGYWKLPSGLILEWGNATTNGSGVGIAQCQKITQLIYHWNAVPSQAAPTTDLYTVHHVNNASVGGFYFTNFKTMKASNGGTVGAGASITVAWFAIGS